MPEREKLIELVKDITENPTTPENDAKYLTDNGVIFPVRCAECIHGKATFLAPDRETVMCCVSGDCVDLNFYCACGERKDNG